MPAVCPTIKLGFSSAPKAKQVRSVSVKAERPNHPSHSHARQGGVVVVVVGGPSSVGQSHEWGGGPPRRHVHDSIRPIQLTVALNLKIELFRLRNSTAHI